MPINKRYELNDKTLSVANVAATPAIRNLQVGDKVTLNNGEKHTISAITYPSEIADTTDSISVSALAEPVDSMFRFLKKAKGKGGVELDDKPEKTKQGHIHMFDSTSYPIYYCEMSPRSARQGSSQRP